MLPLPRLPHLALAFALLTLAATTHAAKTTKKVAEGVTWTKETTTKPWVIHTLTIDLTTPGLTLGATASSQRKQRTSVFAKAVNATAATNADFFSYTDYHTSGLAAGNGAAWSDTTDTATSANLAFGPMQVDLIDAATVLAFDSSWMTGVVSGHPQIIRNGTAITTNSSSAACSTRNPRTAIGMTQNRDKLWMFVVDGRTSASVGMLCTEIATYLKALGAYDAINLDGGGSSTMYLKGTGVVNVPSDGSERVVGNHLAVFAPALGSIAHIAGVVRLDSATGTPIEGASVSIDTTASDTTDGTGSYQLDFVAGAVTVKAAMPGFAQDSFAATPDAGETVARDFVLHADLTADFDGDGVVDGKDTCPRVKNAEQTDTDCDGLGDACDMDDDGDVIADEDDNCPLVSNADQADADKDGIGDACQAYDGGAPGDGGGACEVAIDAGVDVDASRVEDAEASTDAPSAPWYPTAGEQGPTCGLGRGSANSDAGIVGMGIVALMIARRRLHKRV